MSKWFRDGSNELPDRDFAPTLPHGEDAAYADTEPAPLPAPRPAAGRDRFGGLSLAPVETTLYEVMAFIRKDNRVCPQPTRWLEFYRILQECGSTTLPAPPLTGSAWTATPASAKRTCFRDQVEWTEHRCLQKAWEFLKGLPESDWYCSGG